MGQVNSVAQIALLHAALVSLQQLAQLAQVNIIWPLQTAPLILTHRIIVRLLEQVLTYAQLVIKVIGWMLFRHALPPLFISITQDSAPLVCLHHGKIVPFVMEPSHLIISPTLHQEDVIQFQHRSFVLPLHQAKILVPLAQQASGSDLLEIVPLHSTLRQATVHIVNSELLLPLVLNAHQTSMLQEDNVY